jgi:hypothetical protein
MEKPWRIRGALYIVQEVSDRTDADGLLTPSYIVIRAKFI